MDIRNRAYAVEMCRITPNGIHAYIHSTICSKSICKEGNTLTLLRKQQISIFVVKSKSSVFTRFYTLNTKPAGAIGARNTTKKLMSKYGIVKSGIYGINTYKDSFNWLKIFCIKHYSSHFHRIYLRSCAETVSIVSHRIALVIVYNGIAEIDSICCI